MATEIGGAKKYISTDVRYGTEGLFSLAYVHTCKGGNVHLVTNLVIWSFIRPILFT